MVRFLLFLAYHLVRIHLCPGWGSIALYLARKYPKSRIVGLSNSAAEKAHIDSTARARDLNNLEVRATSGQLSLVTELCYTDHHGRC